MMDYKFTANMENQLDMIAQGTVVWYDVLDKFYKEFYPIVQKIKLEKPLIKNKYEKILGKYPGSNEDVIATVGKYGPMLKLSDTEYKKGPIKKPLTLETITLKQAIDILEYPKLLGKIKNSTVMLKCGEFGFYAEVGKKRIQVPSKNVTIDEVSELIKNPPITSTKIIKQFEETPKIYRVMQGESNRYLLITDSKNTKFKLTVSIDDYINTDTINLEDIKVIVDSHYEKKKNKYNTFKKGKK